MTDNRMKQWRDNLRGKGGTVLQVHLSKSVSDKLNALSAKLGKSKKDIVALAIENLK